MECLSICDIEIQIDSQACRDLLTEFKCGSEAGFDASLVIAKESKKVVPSAQFEGQVYTQSIFRFMKTDSGLLTWTHGSSISDEAPYLRSDTSGRIFLHATPTDSPSSILNMLMAAFLPVVARNNGLLFHASLVEYEGRAVAFTASSGTGKSTQADLWHEHLGAEIMNGDRAFVRRFDDEWRAYGSPWAGSSPYIKNVKAPLAGIVVLKQAPENRVRRLNAAEVMTYLYNNVRYPFWDEEATAASLETLDALIREIPIFLLECRPDEEAVRITRDAIFGERN